MNYLRQIKKYFKEPYVPLGIYLLTLILMFIIAWRVSDFMTGLPPNLGKVYSIGQEARTQDMMIVVNGVRRDALGVQSLALRDGNEYIIIDFTLANISSQPLELVPLLHFYLKDSSGRVHQVTPVEGTDTWSGVLLAQDKIREEIGFEILKGAEWLRLYVESGTPSRDIIVIDLWQR